MKILNIVNKTLPLVREVNPALGFIAKKIKSMNTNVTQMTDNSLVSTKALKNPTNQKQAYLNNNLTFFR